MSKELRNRLLTGLIAATLLILLLFFAPKWIFHIVLLVSTLVAWDEFGNLLGISKRSFKHFLGLLVALVSVSHSFQAQEIKSFFFPIFLFLSFSLELIDVQICRIKQRPQKDSSHLFTKSTEYFISLTSLFLLIAFIGPLYLTDKLGPALLLMCFCTVFMNDTFAYFGGKAFGKKRIWPNISPKKTFEGNLAGAAGSFVGAFICYGLIQNVLFDTVPVNAPEAKTVALFALLSAPLSQMGDLFESLFKRHSKVKDSGNIFPGHGGLLDRIDGFLFVFPLAYYLFH